MTFILKTQFAPITNFVNNFIPTTIQKYSKIIIVCFVALGFLAVAYTLLKRKTNKKFTPQQAPKTTSTPPTQITRSNNGTNSLSTQETRETSSLTSSPTPPSTSRQGSVSSSSSTPSTARLRVGEIVPHFPNKAEAESLIRQSDGYIEALSRSPFDRQTRMRTTTPVTQEDFLSHYTARLKTISTSTQRELSSYLQELTQELKKYNIDLPGEINFIQTDGREEIGGSEAYCRGNTIFFKNLWKSLLAHELFHIYTSHHPEIRNKLYAIIGYQICDPIPLPESLMNKRIVNPDSLEIDAYIRVRYEKEGNPEIPQGTSVLAVPIDLYDENYRGNGKSTFLHGIFHKFAIVEPHEDGSIHFKLDKEGNPILFDFNEAGGLVDQIGNNTGYVDSPEEILAENFKIMITGATPNTPEIIERMKEFFLRLAS
jgi:hypothetical protein